MYKKKIFSLLLTVCFLCGSIAYGKNTDNIEPQVIKDENIKEETLDVSLEIEEIISPEQTQLPIESIQPDEENSVEATLSPMLGNNEEIPENIRELSEEYGVSVLSTEDATLLSEYPQSTNEMFAEQLATMNYPRAKFQAVNVDGRIYVLGGVNDDGIVKTVECYNYNSDTWEIVSELPFEIRDFATTAIGNTIYIAGGYVKGEISNRVYAYNILSDSWTEKASMHDCRTRHNLVNANGLLYAVGGRNESGTLNSVESYNFSTNKWTKRADINTPRMDSAIAYGNNKIFVIGGFDEKEGYIGGCECYDIKTAKWEIIDGIGNIENMYTRPNALVYGTDVYVYWKGADPVGYIWQSVYDIERGSWSEPICTWLNNNYFSVSTVEDGICILGGFKDEEYISTVNYMYSGSKPNITMNDGIIKAETVCIDDEIYTIGGTLSTGIDTPYISKYSSEQYKWVRVASMPTARRGFAAEVIDKTIYIIGGYYKGNYEREILAYDTLNNQWSVETRTPAAMERMATTIVDDKLYVIGGRFDSAVLDTMYQYDFLTKEWTTLSNTLRAGMDFGCEAVNGKIYLIGGKDNHVPLNCIDEYDIESNQWTNKKVDFPSVEYLRTVLREGRIIISTQNAYDGTENIAFKEYLPSQNVLLDSTLSCICNNVWYGLETNNDELWVVGGFDGNEYSNSVKIIYDGKQNGAFNNKLFHATKESAYKIHIFATGIDNFSNKVFTINYDPSALSLVDLSAFTPGNDIVSSNKYIKGTDILISGINTSTGIVKFKINRKLPPYSIWEGDVNILKFKALKSCDTKVNVNIE